MRRLWLFLSLLLCFLAINKQLDLQSLLTHVGRQLAHEQGWYERRREVQELFVITIGAGALAGAGIVAWLARGVLSRAPLALLGTCALLAFIFIRAASFHHVDLLLGETVLGVRMNWLFELGGIGCIALSAYRNGTAKRSEP